MSHGIRKWIIQSAFPNVHHQLHHSFIAQKQRYYWWEKCYGVAFCLRNSFWHSTFTTATTKCAFLVGGTTCKQTNDDLTSPTPSENVTSPQPPLLVDICGFMLKWAMLQPTDVPNISCFLHHISTSLPYFHYFFGWLIDQSRWRWWR